MSDQKVSEALKNKAIGAMNQSYSPYSVRQVGSVIKLTNGKEYTGCNIENSSFGATVCAERVAVWKAVSEEGGDIRIAQVVVATDATPPWAPCGLCRQVVNEFAAPDCVIFLVNKSGEEKHYLHRELLPNGFDRSALGK
jgi:cytidine deaminase